MLRQYNPQRFRYVNGRKVGTVDVGTIVYIQDGLRPLGMDWLRPIITRNPWRVEAWNPENHPFYGPGARAMTATVRSLRDGRTQRVADWLPLACVDGGLEKF